MCGGVFCSFDSLALFLLDFLMSNGVVEPALGPFPQGKNRHANWCFSFTQLLILHEAFRSLVSLMLLPHR